LAEKIRLADYFYIQCADTPGEAFRVLSALQEAGVNLLAFSAFPAGSNQSQVDLVPESSDALLKAAKAAGMTLSGRKRCFLIDGVDRPGAVADLLKKLADAKINGTACDAVCAGAGRFGAILWVKPADLAGAAKVLGA
jgi:hypothetical protein